MFSDAVKTDIVADIGSASTPGLARRCITVLAFTISGQIGRRAVVPDTRMIIASLLPGSEEASKIMRTVLVGLDAITQSI